MVEPKAAGAGALHELTTPISRWGPDPTPPNLLRPPWISSDPSQAQIFSLNFISSYLHRACVNFHKLMSSGSAQKNQGLLSLL